jgi:large subunit ribosomal protein L13
MAELITRKFHLFDAEGKTLGRMATEIATILRGKNKINFTPHIDGGDSVVVVNSDRITVSGNKMEGKIYHHFSGYPGGVTDITLKDQLKKDSRKVIEAAVSGMLCKNKLRDKMLTRLFIYKDSQHKHKIDITH